jgi:hypothetical protein
MRDITPAKFPYVTNIQLVNANTEYVHPVTNSTRRLLVRARQSVSLKISFQEGTSGTNYLEIRSGEEWEETEIYGDKFIYMQCETPGTVAEIVEWKER